MGAGSYGAVIAPDRSTHAGREGRGSLAGDGVCFAVVMIQWCGFCAKC